MLIMVFTDVHLSINYGVLAELTYLSTERIALILMVVLVLV